MDDLIRYFLSITISVGIVWIITLLIISEKFKVNAYEYENNFMQFLQGLVTMVIFFWIFSTFSYWVWRMLG